MNLECNGHKFFVSNITVNQWKGTLQSHLFQERGIRNDRQETVKDHMKKWMTSEISYSISTWQIELFGKVHIIKF